MSKQLFFYTGSVVTNPTNANMEDGFNVDDSQDIGVIGKGKLIKTKECN